MYSSDEESLTEEDYYNYANFCKFCSKTIKSWDKVEYCSEHQQVCQINGCERRDTFRGYCSYHEHKCAKYQCEERVVSHRDVCENHLNYHRCDFWSSPALAYRNCKDDFCWKELTINYCKEKGYSIKINDKLTYFCSQPWCDAAVNSSGDYCSDHNKYCQGSGCSTRISNYEDYCSSACRIRTEQAREQNNLKSLVRQKTSLSDPQEVVRFDTWWNKNLATVVNYNSGYWVFLLVYEPPKGNVNEILEKFEINNGYDKYSLESAKNKASSLRNELDGENPILAIIGSRGSISVSNILSAPYLLKTEIPHKVEFEWYGGECTCYPACDCIGFCDCKNNERIKNVKYIYPDNLDEYLKPLDIVWIEKAKFGINFFHVGVYLGKNEMCHIIGGPLDKKGGRITDWSNFIEGGIGKLIRYHPIIPFKHYEKIAKQIAWAGNRQWREGEYCLAGQNCEHAANMINYVIEYSQQVAENPKLLTEIAGRTYAANKNKSSSFVIRDEIQRVNNQLGELNNKIAQGIKENYKAWVEISTKNNCRIM